MLLSHTVALELYQKKLVTEDEVKMMNRERLDLLYQFIPIQVTKPPEVVTRTSHVLVKLGYNEAARQLKGW